MEALTLSGPRPPPSANCSACPKGSLDSHDHVAPGHCRADSPSGVTHSYRPMRRMPLRLRTRTIVRPLTWALPRDSIKEQSALPLPFFLSIHNHNPLRKLTDHELASSRSSLRNHLQLPTTQSSNHPQPNHLNQHKWIPSWR